MTRQLSTAEGGFPGVEETCDVRDKTSRCVLEPDVRFQTRSPRRGGPAACAMLTPAY